MASDSEKGAWPDIQWAMHGWLEVMITLTIAFAFGFLASILKHVPFIGGWLGSQLTGLAESEWANYEQQITSIGEPIIEVLQTWTAAYIKKVLTPIRTAIWALQSAVWRIQHVLIPQVVKYIFQTINQEASSAYASTADERKTAIQQAAQDIVSDLPIVKEILGRLVTIALDLVDVEDPLLRIALGWLLKELINHLGVEHAAGAAFSALLQPLLGQAPPKNLHDTIVAMALDTNANAQWIANEGQPLITDLAADQRIGQVATEVLGGALGVAGLVLMARDPQRAGAIMVDTMKVGLPVLAAVALGTGQIVQAAEFGFLAVMADDPNAWAKDIARLAG